MTQLCEEQHRRHAGWRVGSEASWAARPASCGRPQSTARQQPCRAAVVPSSELEFLALLAASCAWLAAEVQRRAGGLCADAAECSELELLALPAALLRRLALLLRRLGGHHVCGGGGGWAGWAGWVQARGRQAGGRTALHAPSTSSGAARRGAGAHPRSLRGRRRHAAPPRASRTGRAARRRPAPPAPAGAVVVVVVVGRCGVL